MTLERDRATGGRRIQRIISSGGVILRGPGADDRLWKGRTATERLLLLSIVFSPLQRALTIDLGGSPLKISEVLILLALVGLMFSKRDKVPLPRAATVGLSILVVGIVLSTMFALVANVDFYYIGVERSLGVDVLVYCAYSVLVVLIFVSMRTLSLAAVLRALVIAVWVATLFVVIQDLALRSGQLGVLEILNIDTRQRGVAIGDVIGGRSGSFAEGQQLGFFAAGAVVASVWRRSYLTTVAGLYCIVYSQATTGFLALAAAVAVSVLARPRAGTALRVGGGLIVAAIAAAASPIARDWVEFQLQKLGLVSGGANALSSLNIRSMKTDVGFDIMWANPVVGVGPGRYGVYFFPFAEGREVPAYYFSGNTRVIAENAYAQIGAEMGLVGLGGFILLVVALLLGNWRRSAAGASLVAAVAVGVITQSSWTFIPIWIFLAVGAMSLAQTSRISQSAALSSPEGHAEGAARSVKPLRRVPR